MRRTRSYHRQAFSLAILGLAPTIAFGQLIDRSPAPAPSGQVASPARPKRLDESIAEALVANPITAPYRFAVGLRGGKVTLRGRVGSSQAHDAAIRTAIAFGAPLDDQLVIDTFEAARISAAPSGSGPRPGLAGQPASILTSYTYPPPLFGRYDEPFFGLEPPLITHPPYWAQLSQFRQAQNQPTMTQQTSDPNAGQPLPPNTIEVAIDPRGVATLRGIVPTEEDKQTIGQRLALQPGVSGVINRLEIGPLSPKGDNTAARSTEDRPPPDPTPAAVATPPKPGATAFTHAGGTEARVDRAIQDRVELAGQPIKVSIRDGVATLTGTLPTVYEAMLAYRAVQQTPGVSTVNDALQFTVPDGSAANPLRTKGKPEDVEPYLEAQIRRQVGESVHLDRVRLSGDELQVSGTAERADDRPRIDAILRSMPILRGFKILPDFRAADR